MTLMLRISSSTSASEKNSCPSALYTPVPSIGGPAASEPENCRRKWKGQGEIWAERVRKHSRHQRTTGKPRENLFFLGLSVMSLLKDMTDKPRNSYVCTTA